MINDFKVASILSFLEKELIDEIKECSTITEFSQGSILVREGQYIKQLPLILSGMVKVYSMFDGRELLLYYIKPKQSCVMSFSAASCNNPSEIYAIAETGCEILLLPTNRISNWTIKFPRFNRLFYDLYKERYSDLLETINQLVFKRLDERVYNYLEKYSNEIEGDIVNLRHRQIANDLGTAREVVTRTLKKLERDDKIVQTAAGIKIL